VSSFQTVAFSGPHWEFSSSTNWYGSPGHCGGGTTNVGDAINAENRRQRAIYQNGTLSNLAGLRQGGTTSTDEFIVRQNSGNTAFKIVSAADGIVTNNTDTLAVVNGDKLSLRHTTSNTNYRWARFLFLPTADNTQTSLFTAATVFVSKNTVSDADSLTRYIPFVGHLFASTTESNVKIKVKIAGTFRNFRIYMFRYPSSFYDYGAFTIKSRKNGTDGTCVINVPASTGGTGGAHTDLVNSDHVAVDDEYNFSCTANSDGPATATIMQCDFVPDTVNGDQEVYLAGEATTVYGASGSPLYIRICGGGGTYDTASVESLVQSSIGMTSGGRMFRAKVTTNTCSADQTFVLMKNGIATAVTFIVTAGVSSEVVDAVNSVAGNSTDLWDWRMTGGGTGSLRIQYLAMIIPGASVAAGGTVRTYGQIFG
jgi:hypothetical protein